MTASNGHTTYIESLGVYLPAQEVSSDSRVAGIRKRIRVPLERFTGIKSTRRAGPGEFAIDLACRAIESSLARSRFRAEDIGLVIACNISNYDREGLVFPIEPNTATCLRKSLGLRNAMAFDVNNACAGMFTGILLADCLLHTCGIEAAVVVSGEFISHLAETAQQEIASLTDPRLACLTLGDAGAAVVLGRSADPGVGFQYMDLATIGKHSSLCQGGASDQHDGIIMVTDSKELLRVGAIETARHFVDSLSEHGWTLDCVDHLIPHQVSKGAPDMLLREINAGLGGPKLSRKKVVDNLAERGNTATTTHLVALHDHIETERIRSGERVVFSVTASGLTVGTALYVLDDLPARHRNGHAGRQDVQAARVAPPRHTQKRSSVAIAALATTRARTGPPSSTEEMTLSAAEACLRQAPCGRDEIEALVFTGVFKSGYLGEPSYASILAGKLFPHGRRRPLLAFDLRHGPNGFLSACQIVGAMMKRRGLRGGLVLGAEFENNRLLAGYPMVGVAEVATAAVLLPPGSGGTEVEDCRFFTFDEHHSAFRADVLAVRPTHVVFEAGEHYPAALRASIGCAIRMYLPGAGGALTDFDGFYFPQISSAFLGDVADDLGIDRKRVADVTVKGKDLYTSSLPCILEASASKPGPKVCLAVSAGPGIHVGCAVVRG